MYSRLILALGLLGIAALAGAGAGAAAEAAKPKGKGASELARGKTSQKRGIAVRIYPQTVQMLDFNALLDCRDGSELIVEEGGFLPIRTRANGSFRDVQYGRTDTVWLRGKVSRNWVRGKLRVTDRWGKVKCNSDWFRFNARIRS